MIALPRSLATLVVALTLVAGSMPALAATRHHAKPAPAPAAPRGGYRYPSEFIASAISSCQAAAPSVPRAQSGPYCACVIDGLQARFSFGTAIDLLSQMKHNYTPPTLKPVIGACLLDLVNSAQRTPDYTY